jgi:hypothetical protein
MFLPRVTKGLIPPMKEQYIAEIMNLLEQCNDVALLDLVKKLLLKC